MNIGGYEQVNFEKVKLIPFEFLISIVRMAIQIKSNIFTIKDVTKYVNKSRKTIDKYIKRLVNLNCLHISAQFDNAKNSTKKSIHYEIPIPLIEKLVMLCYSIDNP